VSLRGFFEFFFIFLNFYFIFFKYPRVNPIVCYVSKSIFYIMFLNYWLLK